MKSKSGGAKGQASKMIPTDAARIQSATAKANGGAVPKASFAARAQSTVAKTSKS